MPDTQTVTFSKTVILTDTQIKTLPTVDVELIPAQGANKIIVPVGVSVVFNVEDIYTGTTDATLALGLADIPIANYTFTQNILQTASLLYSFLPVLYQDVISSGLLTGLIAVNYSIPAVAVANQPLTLRDSTNGGVDYGGGGSSNYMKLTIAYTVVDIS